MSFKFNLLVADAGFKVSESQSLKVSKSQGNARTNLRARVIPRDNGGAAARAEVMPPLARAVDSVILSREDGVRISGCDGWGQWPAFPYFEILALPPLPPALGQDDDVRSSRVENTRAIDETLRDVETLRL
jgi:hypothetical protein